MKIDKRGYLIILFILIIIALFYYLLIIKNENPKVCIENACFNVEIAKSQEELSNGLMFRKSLDEKSGMLFIFQAEAQHYFWMKNTLIPLDMIWLNKDKEIIYISKNTQICKSDPCPSYGPDKLSLYVLEINSGLSDEYGFKEGDIASLTNIE